MSDPVTVVLADDHVLVREMLQSWLAAEGIGVVGCSGTTDEALTLVAEHQPDVLVLDIELPGRSAFTAAREAVDVSPATRVLFLSAFVHDGYVRQALACEASGYLTKSEPPEVLVEAIRRVAEGGTRFSPEVLDRIVVDAHGARLMSGDVVRIELLTAREREVLAYVGRGLHHKQIARRMGLSVKTVQTHIANVMDKLDIHDRVDLARFAIREGLIEA